QRQSRTVDPCCPAVEEDLAAVVRIHARENSHEGGFPGAVFADQPVHFTRKELQVDISQRVRTGKAFADAHHPDDRLRGSSALCHEILSSLENPLQPAIEVSEESRVLVEG